MNVKSAFLKCCKCSNKVFKQIAEGCSINRLLLFVRSKTKLNSALCLDKFNQY